MNSPARSSFRKHVIVVGAVSVTMLAATVLTCRRAERETGNRLFLHSQRDVIAFRPPPVDSKESADWDAAMRDVGEPVDQGVRVYMPIVGLLDATLPVICLGLAWLGIVALRNLRLRDVDTGPHRTG